MVQSVNGWHSTRTMIENIAKVQEAFLEDWRRTIHDVCSVVRLLCVMCQRISSDEVSVQHIATELVLMLLSNDQKDTALLSALSSRSRPKTTPTLSPPSLLVTNLGCLFMTLRQHSSHLSGGLQLHCDWKSTRGSEQCPLNVDLFFWHRRHRAQGICSTRTDGEWKILLQRSEANEGKHPVETSRQVAQLLGPASWQRSSSHLSRATVFGFCEDDSHPPSSLLTGPPRPMSIFPIPKDEIEAQGAAYWHHWRDPDHITGCDEDADMKRFPAVLLIRKSRWDPCIDAEGDYFEGDSGE